VWTLTSVSKRFSNRVLVNALTRLSNPDLAEEV